MSKPRSSYILADFAGAFTSAEGFPNQQLIQFPKGPQVDFLQTSKESD